MSGFWRNFLTLLFALFRKDARIVRDGCSCWFWVTPFDVGLRTLKSDKYLQLAEAAQLDFGMRSGLVANMRAARCAMVNAEQHIEFKQAIHLFDRVRVHTRMVRADAKRVQFEHDYFVGGQLCATVRVLAKFKAGRVTVPTAVLVPELAE